jgi:hypothetical protein
MFQLGCGYNKHEKNAKGRTAYHYGVPLHLLKCWIYENGSRAASIKQQFGRKMKCDVMSRKFEVLLRNVLHVRGLDQNSLISEY